MMNRYLPACLAVFALTVPAGATSLQDLRSDYDQFTVEEPVKPLDELVPVDQDKVPPMPADVQPADSAPTEAGEPPQTAGPAASEPEAASAPAAEPADGAVHIAAAAAPDGWKTITFGAYSFALPPDFVKAEEKSDHVIYFKGDMKTHEGIAFMVAVDSIGKNDLPSDEKSVAMSDVVLPGGMVMTRRTFEEQLDKKTVGRGILMISEDAVSDEDHLLITEIGFNRTIEDHADLYDTILTTFRAQAPAKAPEAAAGPIVALDGLVSVPPQKDWHVSPSATGDFITFRPRGTYAGYVEIAKGKAATGSGGLAAKIPEGTPSAKAIVFDQFATRFEWAGTSRDFQRGASLLAGKVRVTLLADCLPSGEAVAVLVTGLPEFMDGDKVKDLFAAISFAMPADSGACPAAGAPTAEAAPEPGPVTQAEAASEPAADAGQATPQPAPDILAEPEAASTPAVPTPTPATATMPGTTTYAVQGVTFSVPAGWTVKHSAPGDLQLDSPDGRFTLLAFWWLPDEPLLGYDDIVSVENIVIDHEPTTRITSKFPDRSTVQSVTERARSDKKRFIFTLDGAGDLDGEMQMLLDHLVGSLHWHAGFAAGASKGPTGPIQTAGPASASAGGSAAVPASPAANQGVTIDFADGGIGGWTAVYGTLSNPGRGGPQGGGYLKAFTPGDGHTGYFIAPTRWPVTGRPMPASAW